MEKLGENGLEQVITSKNEEISKMVLRKFTKIVPIRQKWVKVDNMAQIA